MLKVAQLPLVLAQPFVVVLVVVVKESRHTENRYYPVRVRFEIVAQSQYGAISRNSCFGESPGISRSARVSDQNGM